MYRPTIQSNLWLGLMALIFIGLYYWSDNSRVAVRPTDYSTRKQAAETMMKALEILQDFRLPEAGRYVSDSMLVYHTMLGDKDSPITTDEGRLADKITVLNPNLAAAMVDMFDRAGVSRGDTAAVLLTGSMPGANIALFSAAKAIGIHLVVMTSVGSSWWGANSPDFTWLDMERVLEQADIFSYRSLAASAGGSDDNGGLRLSEVGRQMIADAADRNGVIYIQEESLSNNIQARLTLFRRIMPLERYKVVVNIGGGIASLGHPVNGRLIPTGVNRDLPEKNYPNWGAVHYFAESKVPVMHIYDVSRIAQRYDLPIAQLPLPEVGVGKVYEYQRYNLKAAAVGLILMFGILAMVKYFDSKRYKWREEKVDPDTIV